MQNDFISNFLQCGEKFPVLYVFSAELGSTIFLQCETRLVSTIFCTVPNQFSFHRFFHIMDFGMEISSNTEGLSLYSRSIHCWKIWCKEGGGGVVYQLIHLKGTVSRDFNPPPPNVFL